jgi:hypothetical protein
MLMGCLFGAAAFGGVFVVAAARPLVVERVARGFLTRQLERELGIHEGAATPDMLETLVEGIVGGLPRTPSELVVVRPERLREAVRSAEATGPSQPARAPAEQSGKDYRTLAEAAYRRLIVELVHELRIFSGTTCVLFAATVVLAASRRRDARQLLLPACILAGATCFASVTYLISQRWFWTFLTADYVGYGYLVLTAGIAALLVDIAYNRGRVTSIIARRLWWWPTG